MRTICHTFLNFLLYSNLWIGLGAAAQVFLTMRYIGWPLVIQAYPYRLACALGLGTMSFYSWIRYEKLRQHTFDGTNARMQVLSDHRSHLLVIAGLTSGFALYLIWPFLGSARIWALLVTACILTVAYVWWPFGRPMRSVHWLKTFLVPVVWVLVVVLLPYLVYGGNPRIAVLMAFERFCFIFAITVPFDLRDAHTDASNGIRTIANSWSNQRPTYLALVVLGVGLLAHFSVLNLLGQHSSLGALMPVFSIAAGIYALTGVLIWYLREPAHDYWYSGGLDGTLVLWLLSVC